jgi:Arc/MetJ-type ribon-helix-helix transcriptional regulator
VYDTTRYVEVVARPISVRLDDDALRALRVLQASGMSRSEAVRSSLVAAAERLRRRSSLAAEAAELEADEADRREMQEIAAFMEQVRAPR